MQPHIVLSIFFIMLKCLHSQPCVLMILLLTTCFCSLSKAWALELYNLADIKPVLGGSISPATGQPAANGYLVRYCKTYILCPKVGQTEIYSINCQDRAECRISNETVPLNGFSSFHIQPYSSLP